MSELESHETGTGADGGPEARRTGHRAVDAVVASTEDLQDRPVGEHVEIFESAHDRLRATLADAGQQPDDAPRPAPR